MIFIDTGAFLARYVERDQYHQAATACWGKIQQQQRRCFTSNFVLDETFTLLARRTTYQFSAERAANLLASKSLTILRPDEQDELAALQLFRKYADQRVSFTDCISFVLMDKHGLQSVFTFDRHFELAGFLIEAWRERLVQASRHFSNSPRPRCLARIARRRP